MHKGYKRIESVTSISIKDLKRMGLLVDGEIHAGNVSTYRKKIKVGSFAVLVDVHSSVPYVAFAYTLNDRNISFTVFLEKVSSNLGKGHYYYFICPITGKQCRNLYLSTSNGRFVHRSQIEGYIYETQAESKKWSKYRRTYSLLYLQRNALEELNKKYGKNTYKGIGTKRYKRLIKIIDPTIGKPQPNYSAQEAMVRMMQGKMF